VCESDSKEREAAARGIANSCQGKCELSRKEKHYASAMFYI
jgi:hypothetical protein